MPVVVATARHLGTRHISATACRPSWRWIMAYLTSAASRSTPPLIQEEITFFHSHHHPLESGQFRVLAASVPLSSAPPTVACDANHRVGSSSDSKSSAVAAIPSFSVRSSIFFLNPVLYWFRPFFTFFFALIALPPVKSLISKPGVRECGAGSVVLQLCKVYMVRHSLNYSVVTKPQGSDR